MLLAYAYNRCYNNGFALQRHRGEAKTPVLLIRMWVLPKCLDKSGSTGVNDVNSEVITLFHIKSVVLETVNVIVVSIVTG